MLHQESWALFYFGGGHLIKSLSYAEKRKEHTMMARIQTNNGIAVLRALLHISEGDHNIGQGTELRRADRPAHSC